MNEKNRARPASTRRQFLQNASVLVGGAALAGSRRAFAQAPRVPTTPRQRLGVALVGLGSYSTGQLAPALQETEKCYLAGIVTGTPATAEEWQRRHDIPGSNVYNYENFDRIADNGAIDVVYVVLPNSMHPEFTIRAARAGKHVIVEKPMATTVRDCERMIDVCEQAGVKLSIGYRLHFDPFHQEIMRLGQEQVFGPVKVVEGSFSFFSRTTDAWRFDKELAGGGALLDVGVYVIQGARYVIGEDPVAVRATAYTTEPDAFSSIYETYVWQMEFPSGAVSMHTSSYSGSVNRLYMMSTRGWAEINPSYGYGGQVGRTSQGPMDFQHVNQQALMMDDFAECIVEDRESRVSGQEGLTDMRIIEAIYRSIDGDGARVLV